MEKTRLTKEDRMQQVIPLLRKKGFQIKVLRSEKEVKNFINSKIPEKTIVGLGDSITTCKLNLRHLLAAKGTTIFYSWNGSYNYNRSLDTFEIPARPDYYITRIGALTTNGEILMNDYDLNAANDGNFPLNMLAFVGLNRICETFENNEVISKKYPVLIQCPNHVNFNIALLPFLDY
jgi:hypothetical protein